jgi:hypothetical protein
MLWTNWSSSAANTSVERDMVFAAENAEITSRSLMGGRE